MQHCHESTYLVPFGTTQSSTLLLNVILPLSLGTKLAFSNKNWYLFKNRFTWPNGSCTQVIKISYAISM